VTGSVNIRIKRKLIKHNNIKPLSYLIYNDGRVYSLLSHKFLTLKPDKDGYLTVNLRTANNTQYKYRVATIVIFHFVGCPPRGMGDATVDHKDGNRKNNYFKNLQWLERGENSSRRKNKGVGSQNHAAILNETQVAEICNLLMDATLSLRQIANKYNVRKSTISNIKRKKNWTNVSAQYDFGSTGTK
jgi:hypothetical protein